MGLKDWTKKIFPNDYDVDEDYEDDFVEPEEQQPVREREEVRRDPKPAPAAYPTQPSAVKLAPHSGSSIEMKVVSPARFDEVTQIADYLLENKTVLLNLEKCSKETAKRLIDFLSGVAYALGGDVQKVADNTFAITPNNVAVSNESLESDSSANAEEPKYE